MARQPVTIKTPFLDVSTDDGDDVVSYRIYEDDLPRLTKADLKKLRISREVLHECFAEGVRLMKDRDWAKCRPCADEHADGTDEVYGTRMVLIVGYNQYTHPLMKGPASGNA
jgi:hypothetical protein